MKQKKLLSMIISLSMTVALFTPFSADARIETENLLNSSSLIKADYNNGSDVSVQFNQLTDGDYETNQTIHRGGGVTHTYYAVYEVNSYISSISVAYNATGTKAADVVFYGSNDDELALKTTPPDSDMGWSGDGQTNIEGKFDTEYGLTYLANPFKTGNETDNGLYCTKTVSFSDAVKYKYIVVLMNGWTDTIISEIEVNGIDGLKTDETGCLEHVYKYPTNSGALSENQTTDITSGSFQDVSKTVTTIGWINRNDSSRVLYPVYAEREGIYNIIVLGAAANEKQKERKYSIAVNSPDISEAIYCSNSVTDGALSSVGIIGDASAYEYAINNVPLDQGINMLYIYGADGVSYGDAPTFAAIKFTQNYETTGALAPGEVFCFDSAPEVIRKGTSDAAIYTDKGVYIKVGTGYTEGSQTMTGLEGTELSELEGKTLYKVGAIDKNSSETWNGYVQVTFDIPQSGRYTLTLLGDSGEHERQFGVEYGSTEALTDKFAGLRVKNVELDMEAGEQTIFIKSNPAPNFIALVLLEAQQAPACLFSPSNWSYTGTDGKYTVEGNKLTDSSGNVFYGYSASVNCNGITYTSAVIKDQDGTEKGEYKTPVISGTGNTFFYLITNSSVEGYSVELN